MRLAIVKCCLVLLFLVNFAGVSFADYRYYAWTYQFITMLPGRTEIEFYSNFVQPDDSRAETSKWKRQIEIETGLSENWDFSFYLVDSYKAEEAKTKFEEIKIRTRHKLAEKDEFIVDPLFYVEYKIQTDRTYPDKWETKLILAKDLEDLNIAVNIIPEEYYKTGTKEKDWKIEYAAGMSYPVSQSLLRLGIETKGDFKDKKYALGPAIAFRGKNIWAAIGYLSALNERTDDTQVQTVLGIIF
ncbi:MAG TPA: hypothetical protein VJC03_09215 [bacterium]|nr:hypothetical protein [bacterium]